MIFKTFFSSYYSVSHLLLGVVLPSSSRSIFVGLIAIEGLSALSQSASTPAIIATIGNSSLFFVFAGIVAASAKFMFFMMPEIKGRTLEYIFRCPRHEGCIIRRDLTAEITQTVETIKRVSRALGYSYSRRRGGEGGK
jgi:hypothetical protein